jgi:hypothetical protein
VNPRAGLDDVEKRKFLTLPGLELDPSVVQPVASRYTDYAIPASLSKPRLNLICVSYRENILNRQKLLYHLVEYVICRGRRQYMYVQNWLQVQKDKERSMLLVAKENSPLISYITVPRILLTQTRHCSFQINFSD